MTVTKMDAQGPLDIAAHVEVRRDALPEDVRGSLSPRPWGLALSGGGIRSATFCFGLLKALASKQLLRRFDVLSTVSGGGYIGSTVGKLFQNEATAAFPDPIAVEAAIAEADTRWYAAWLRANGRYLIPRGAKDVFEAAANFGRNFLGVHVEIALLSLLLGGVLVGIDLATWQWADCIYANGACGGIDYGDGVLLGWLSRFPTVWMLLVPIGWLAAVAGCAYWSLPRHKDRPLEPGRIATAVVMAFAFLVVLRHVTESPAWLPRWTGSAELPAMLVVFLLALFAAWIVGTGVACALALVPSKTLDWARNRLNATLSFTLRLAVAVAAIGAIDQLAWRLGNLDVAVQSTFGFAVLVIGAALRAALPKIGDLPKSLAPSTRRVVMTLIALAGLLVLVLVVVFWMAIVHRATADVLFGTKPAELRFGLAWQWLAWVFVPPLLLVAMSAGNREFMNRSSLYTFYRARLIRSYLGAANDHRFRRDPGDVTTARSPMQSDRVPSDVTDVDPDDDVPMAEYAPHRVGGPVHLINACINQTRDPRGGLFNQDRKGLLLTVGPNGQARADFGGWQSPSVEARMTLGSWVAISGAAIAPGLGASTRSGIAAILTLAGLRLGYWWNSESLALPEARKRNALGKYGQLLSELRGRFNGSRQRDWYLSDGGHFENTAAYALLREECEVIIIADCGADPRFAFADLENLVRKARIDLQAEITFLRPRAPHPSVAAFGSLNELASTDSDASLALARVDYRHSGRTGHLFIVKPNMCRGAPVDLVNFKADNPLFPQEPTTDQFFGEAQWESYFQLGQMLGGKLELNSMREAEAFASEFFVDDDGAVLVQGEDGSQAVRFSSKRLSSRVAATGAVSASISLGAVMSIGIAVFQGISSELSAGARAAAIDPAAYKELTDIFGKMPVPAAVAAASGRPTEAGALADNDSRIGEMATALLRVGDSQCNDRNTDAFRRSKLMRLMVESTRAACRRSSSRHWSCEDLLVDASLPPCLQNEPRNACRPMYWTRDYGGDDSDAAANCATPVFAAMQDQTIAAPAASSGPVVAVIPGPASVASGQEVPASAASPRVPASGAVAAATPSFAGQPCAGRTVYIQIYGGELRDYVRGFRDPWRALGASVPTVEDVDDSARRARKRPPQPFSQTTVVYYDERALACVNQLTHAVHEEGWAAKLIAGGSEAQRRTIEVWMPSARTPDTASIDDLIGQLDAESKQARIGATTQLIIRHGNDPRTVAEALALIEPPRLDALSASGRINVLVLLRNTQSSAWDVASVERARQALMQIRARASGGVAIGPQTEAELGKVKAFLDALNLGRG